VYQVGVWTRSAGNTANQSEKSAAVAYTITPRVTSVSLTSSLVSPQAPNTTITWTATPGGGVAPYQYQWLVYDGATWNNVGSWTSSNTFAWTPAQAGSSYQVGVWTRSAGNSNNASEKSAAAPFAIQSRVSAVSLSANATAPVFVNTTVSWTATPTGGVAPIQYQWLVYDGVTWNAVGGWTTTNTFAWTPATANASYQVGVWTRSAGNTNNQSEKSAAVPFAVNARVTAVSLSANLSAPQPANTTINWTATPTSGTAPIQYQWLVYDGANWNTVGSWTTSNTFAWTPTQAGASYQVGVWTRSSGNTANASEKSAAAAFAITVARVTSVSLTADASAPRAMNATVTWTATPTGGTAPIQYQWLVYDGTTWNTVGGWTTTNTFAWTPTTANASYQVGVWTRSSGNTANASEKSAAVPFAVARVTSVSLSANRAAPQAASTTVTWTATPSGGAAPYEYQWLVFDGTTWNTVGSWTSSNTFAWTPSQANANYQVGVWTRGAGDTANASEKSAAVLFAIQ
jgi:cell wall-associated protease